MDLEVKFSKVAGLSVGHVRHTFLLGGGARGGAQPATLSIPSDLHKTFWKEIIEHA